MAGKSNPRRRGPPSIWDKALRPAYLDRMGADAIRAINETVTGTSEERAADAAVLRGQILRMVRNERLVKPTEASLAKADRLKRVAQALNDVNPKLSARGCAEHLKRRGLFLDVESDTLRKDIASIRKLAHPR